jgi:hypothetical protein
MDTTTDFGTWWGSLALINAGLAQTKGRSRWNWFLISLLLGPLATFLIVVWAPPAGTTTVTGTGTTTTAPTEG